MMHSAFRRLWFCLLLGAVFLRELALSSWAVARAAFARNPRFSPAIVAVPLRLRTDLGIATLANLVSLTPGTTSLHVSQDRSILYVHCLDAVSADEVRSAIHRAFEVPIMEIEG